jgi:choline-sulfatase
VELPSIGRKVASHVHFGDDPVMIAALLVGRPFRRTNVVTPGMRRYAALCVVGVLGGWLVSAGCRRAESGRPGCAAGFNVLLITLDTTRADCLGCYGHPVVKTPAIDRLAAEGATFTQCTSCVPITLPSHASILTATYPFVHGTRLNGTLFADEGNVTLPEILRGAGYATGAEVAAVVLEAMWGIDQGFDTFGGLPPRGTDAARDRPTGPLKLMASEPADAVCDRAIQWLAEHGSERFFLWVHFFDPHAPYEPPEPFQSQYENPYLGEIAFMDQQIGQLVNRLKANDLDRKTLVVVVGDHGEAFAQHREGTHGYFVYDSTLQVPLIFRCPGKIPAGRRIEAQVSIVDITPTLLDFLGMAPKPDAQGVSLLSLLSGREEARPRAVYAECMAAHLDLGYAPLWCLRSGGWKYIHAPTPELYDVANDPGETVNLAAKHPDRVADMREQLRGLIAESEPVASSRAEASPLDAVTAARLAALGYVGGATGHEMGDELEGFLELDGPDPKDRIGNHHEFIKAKMYSVSGSPEKALSILETLRQIEADNPAVLQLLGDLRRDEGNVEEAAVLYQQVLRLQPKRAIARFHLGKILGELGRIDEAVDHLRRAAEDMPKYPDARAYLALALAKQGQAEEAVKEFEQALALDPTHEESRIGLSETLCGLGRFGEGVETLREGLRRTPGSIRLANNLAWILATAPEPDLRDGTEAVRLAEATCERLRSLDPASLDTLAAAYACAGRFEDGVRTARRAIELATANGQTELAGRITARLRKYEAGQPHVEPAPDGR